jgi:hypothetical protein
MQENAMHKGLRKAAVAVLLIISFSTSVHAQEALLKELYSKFGVL